MANETILTLVGNLVADPELRFTPAGAAVANFTVASTPRTFDKTRSEWVDGDSMFLNCSVWRQAAENVEARAATANLPHLRALAARHIAARDAMGEPEAQPKQTNRRRG